MKLTRNRRSVSAREIAPPLGFLGNESAILFTDMVSSTSLAQSLGDAWPDVIVEHHEIVRRHCDSHGGFEATNQGDGFLYLFQHVPAAASAAVAIIQELEERSSTDPALSVRAGIHWGAVRYIEGVGFSDLPLHEGSRVADVAGPGQILLSGAAADRAANDLPSGTSLVESGVYSLRSLAHNHRILELVLDGRSPKPPTAQAIDALELPVFPSELVGRDLLLAELGSVLEAGPASVVTLCGIGGVGKTRLAVALLESVTDRPCYFVDLSQATSPSQLFPAIGRALGIDVGLDMSTHDLARVIDKQKAMLVVDNLEQIVQCAPELGLLARSAPAARVIATSRVPLRLVDERVIVVDPLPIELPDDGSLMTANTLLMRLASIDSPTDRERELGAKVCSLVDGLPLAIELAAGRAELLGLEELAKQLEHSVGTLVSGRRDGQDRHSTIASTVLWSYALLSNDARFLFRALSQFPAGAGVDAMVALGVLDRDQVLNSAAELIEHHLVRGWSSTSGRRYGMLRVIREVAEAELDKAGELVEVRHRASQFLQDHARDAAQGLGGSNERAAYGALLDELENFRLLFEWTADEKTLDAALVSASDLLMFWWHDHLADGVSILRRLTELPEAEISRHFPRALVSMSILSTYGGDPGESMRLAEQAVAAARDSSPRGPTLCTALQQVSLAHAARGDGSLALAAAAEALDVAQDLPEFGKAMQLVGIGPVLLCENHVERAEASFVEAIRIFDQAGRSWLAAAPVARLAECAIRRGDLSDANEHALEGVKRWADSPGVNGNSRARSGLARVRWCEGNIDDSRSIVKDAAAFAVEFNAVGDLPWALIVAGAVAASARRFDLADRLFMNATSLARSYSQPILGALRHELSVPLAETAQAVGSATSQSSDSALPDGLHNILELIEAL